ncbi:MAG: NAD-dependent epimerase/dehydratase family protein [Planctomycetota bacterium]
MRALVTGGCGFLGGNLIQALLPAGVAVRCLDVQTAPPIALATRGDCEFVCGDLGDAAVAAQALIGIDTVFHLAAPFWIAGGQQSPAQDVELNLLRGVRFLEQCVAAGVRRVIFPSSGGAVYGLSGGQALAETDLPQPVVSYGIVKLALERYLAMFHRTHGLEYAALRVSNPYGPGQRPHRGQGVVATLLECARTGAPFTLFAPRTTVRDYLYVADVAAAFVAAAQAPGPLAAVLNVGSGRGVRLDEMIAAVERVSGRAVQVEERAPRGFDVPANVLDCRLALEKLGWQATTDLATGLQKTWEWIAARPQA